MTPKTLTKEREEKFNDIVSEWITESPAITDVTGDSDILESEIKRLCKLLVEASKSRSEIQAEYKIELNELNAEVMRGDWREYPEHLHEVAKCLRDVWMFELPAKPQKRTNKSNYSFWVISMDELKQSCAEFGIKALENAHKKWRDGFKDGIAPFTVASPQSLIKYTASIALEMRQAQSEVKVPRPEIEEWRKGITL